MYFKFQVANLPTGILIIFLCKKSIIDDHFLHKNIILFLFLISSTVSMVAILNNDYLNYSYDDIIKIMMPMCMCFFLEANCQNDHH